MTLHKTTFEAIGTHWTIDAWCDLTLKKWDALQTLIHKRIDAFDKTYSRFQEDSLITHMSQTAGTYKMPDDGYALLHFYERLYRATDGKVTPLIGQTVSDAGYDARYSLTSQTLQSPAPWDEIIEHSESELTMHKPALLDFGAAGKGYLIDIIGAILTANGVDRFVINAGGDMLHRATTPHSITVGLEHPLDTTQVIGTIELQNASLCASAGSRRKWGKYHHIIDPSKLESPTEILATWVIADHAIVADGLATALFFARPDKLAKQFSFSFALLHQDMALQYSDNFPVTLFEEPHA